MPISPEDLTVHFTSTLMALIRTALEIKLASGEREAMSDSRRGLKPQLLAWCPPKTTEILAQVEILFSYCLPPASTPGQGSLRERW